MGPSSRVGPPDRDEIVLSVLTYSDRAGIDPATGCAPAAGTQDGGIGFKHLLHDSWIADVRVRLSTPSSRQIFFRLREIGGMRST